MKRIGILVLAALLLAAAASPAQDDARGPDGTMKQRVPGVEVLTIPGKPFSASTTTDWTRTLEDGSVVATHLEATLARDSRGRVYRERHSFVPSASGAKAPLNEIHIMDPHAQTQIYCSTHAMQCVIYDYTPETLFNAPPVGPSSDGTRTLARESLGSDSMEGLFVTGTRETTTIRLGAVGNEQPLILVREFWYSEDLQTNLAVTRIDPREGKQVIRLSHISVGEPDAHLFEIPIGYRVRDLRANARRAR